MKKITKSNLVDGVFEKLSVKRSDICDVVDAFLFELKNAMENGSNIALRGFGSFELRLRKGRSVARNPRTGEKLSVQPHYVAAFRAGKELKENLWNLKIENNEK